MKTKIILLAAGMFLATTLAGFSQPTIFSLTLGGKPSPPNRDFQNNYATFSVSLGADVIFRAYASPEPLSYQWQFNATNLPAQTNANLILTNVQLTNAGAYAVVLAYAAGTTSRVATLTVDPAFTKITTGEIVTDSGFCSGCTWGDYNNDGFLDLFVCNEMGGIAFDSFLYRNNGNGTFTKVTSGPPVDMTVNSVSAAWGDYDNDGNLDLFQQGAGGTDQLFHNNSDGTFTRITTNPISPDLGFGGWVDHDKDGFLDLFATGFDPSGSTNAHNFLLRNNGDGTFSAITNGNLVTDLESSRGGAWADYDNDGNPDVFLCARRLAGILRPNRLYHNNGDGTFSRITTGSIVNDLVSGSYSCAWGDYDNNGHLDLFVANGNGQKNFLYQNNGDGTFARITNGIVVNDLGGGSQPGCNCGSYGCAWGDYDNDGFLDLIVVNEGPPEIVPTVVNFLYHNNGEGTFTKITTGSPVNEYSDSWGCAWGDYDNDGFLDLFATRGDARGNYLYRNNGNSNSWLTVKLVGTVSNRSAVGAKVRAKASYRGASRWQVRQINGGGPLFGGANELLANFGFGDATNINTVRIEWPSGTVQELHNVPAKQFLTVIEPPRL